jgi:uncharacterized protein YjbI with pentapeptide repeats
MGWLQDYGWIVVVATLALGGLPWWIARRRRAARAVPGAAARRRVDLAFTLAVLVTLVVGLVAVRWLLDQADQLAGKEQAAAQADAIRTGATIALGTGGAAYLLLAYRRQRLEEVDTRERRITELYTKAVEQLGGEMAPVRLGALYSLERLAQNNPEHRQTVIDVVCAYLRMPYTPPPRNEWNPTQWQAPWFSAAGQGRPAVRAAGQGPDQEVFQELEVRQTAQRILVAHLRLPAQTISAAAQRRRPSPRQSFWPGISLDLSGAALVDVDCEQLSVIEARFDGATFQGRTVFDRATFQGDAGFDGATFQGSASFESAAFQGNASFGWATFQGLTSFSSATFQHRSWFANATFQGDASFGMAKFNYCVFDGVTFQGDARARARTAIRSPPAAFNDAVFQRGAKFVNAAFQRDAEFHGTTFRGDAGFDRAVFQGIASFRAAKFESEARFSLAKFEGHTDFHGAKFQGVGLVPRDEYSGLRPGFKGATFQGAAWFAEAIFTSSKGIDGVAGAIVLHLDDPDLNKRRVWPDGCTVRPDPADPSRGRVVRPGAEEPVQDIPPPPRWP